MTPPVFGPFSDGTALLGQIGSIVDQANQPLPGYKFSSPPSWAVSDSTVLSVSPAADGLTAQLKALKAGSATVTVVGDGVTETCVVNVIVSALGGFSITVVPA